MWSSSQDGRLLLFWPSNLVYSGVAAFAVWPHHLPIDFNLRPLPRGKRNPTPRSHRREALMAISDAHQFGGVARNASRSTCFRALPLRSGIITVQIPTSLISFPQFSENFVMRGELCIGFASFLSYVFCENRVLVEFFLNLLTE